MRCRTKEGSFVRRQRRDNGATGDCEAIEKPYEKNHRVGDVLRRYRRCGVLDDQTIVAEEARIHEGCEQAAIDVDASEHQGRHAQVSQHTVEFVVPEPAQTMLADDNVGRVDVESVDHLRAPIAETEYGAATGARRISVARTGPVRIAGMENARVEI